MYRIVNWMCTSESKKIATSFQKTNDDLMVEINVEKGCFNAGKINKFGKSCYPTEEETLIPPYSVFKVDKIDGYNYCLSLARDNKNYDFDHEVSNC